MPVGWLPPSWACRAPAQRVGNDQDFPLCLFFKDTCKSFKVFSAQVLGAYLENVILDQIWKSYGDILARIPNLFLFSLLRMPWQRQPQPPAPKMFAVDKSLPQDSLFP